MITNETLKIIKQRRSIRSYRPEQIKDEELQTILEAGLYAPHALDQSWHFTVVQNKELLNKLNDAAKEVARKNDIPGFKEMGEDTGYNCLYDAPTLVIISGDENAHVPLEADCAAATLNLLLAAESIGVGSCWIYFVLMAFESSQGAALRRELKIPAGYKPYSTAVLGYKRNSAVRIPARKPNLITYIK